MIWTDIAQLTGAFLVVIAAVLPVVNPLGCAPIFLAMTPGCDEPTRKELSRRIALNSFFLLLGSTLLGSFVLRFFGISVPIVQVAGGAVVCALGWDLLRNHERHEEMGKGPEDARKNALQRAFYPLTLPLTVDAGAISVAVTIGANHAHTFEKEIIQILAAFLGSGAIALIVFLAYRYAEQLGRRIGKTGMTAALQLSAFIMLCIGVQICWNGIRTLLLQAGIGN